VARPPLEVADIITALRDATGAIPGLVTSVAQDRVARALAACRTSRLGGHVDQCDRCQHRQISYNSCRNRHCPKCQGSRRLQWIEDRGRDLLPVAYFHVVFTIPADLAPVALQNKKLVYDILFRAAAETLLQIAADPKRLGAKIGFVAVVHTWGQTLMHHPHLHCMVPGGGLSSDGKRWIASRTSYLVPVKVLSRVFRGKFLDYLGQAHRAGKLSLRATLEHLGSPEAFGRLLAEARAKPWVVYAKPPVAGPEQVLRYLARYTHRVAIANSRLVSLEDGKVSFRYKDYSEAGRQRTMRLEAVEFLRRFLLHVLPARFVRIRHYGLLANCCRRDNVARCRKLIDLAADHAASLSPTDPDSRLQAPRCPQCGLGTMVTIETFTAAQALTVATPARLDSS
jgi:hypothetical protein